jgi:hypothetical protein
MNLKMSFLEKMIQKKKKKEMTLAGKLVPVGGTSRY